MKKTKVIVPALGILLLSTAASISGSVAWFTATRTFETDIANFQVANTDGALAVTMTGGVQTTAASGGQSVSIDSGTILGDASLDHINGVLYTDTVVANTYKSLGAISAAEEDTSKWLVGGTTYYAVSWNMSFTYTFSADVTQQNLYLDSTSEMAIGDTTTANATGNTKVAALGFRIAFVGQTATYSNKKVWSDTQTDAKMQEFDYVNATNGKGNYSGDIISTANTGGTSGLVTASDTTGAASAANCLGYFASGHETITFKCVAWFEGLDENVVSGTLMQKITANMKFFVTPNA